MKYLVVEKPSILEGFSVSPYYTLRIYKNNIPTHLPPDHVTDKKRS